MLGRQSMALGLQPKFHKRGRNHRVACGDRTCDHRNAADAVVV